MESVTPTKRLIGSLVFVSAVGYANHMPTMAGQPPVTMIGGKPSGQTMAIRRVDEHHYIGKPLATTQE